MKRPHIISRRSPVPSFSWKTTLSVGRWRAGAGAASLPSWIRRSMGKQQNVTGDQLARWPALRVLQHGRPAQYDMIGDLAELGGRKVDAPGRAEEASVIERALDWYHLQKPAQPVVGIFHIDLVYKT